MDQIAEDEETVAGGGTEPVLPGTPEGEQWLPAEEVFHTRDGLAQGGPVVEPATRG